MPETIIESVINGKLSAELLIKWLNDHANEDTPEECTTLCCNKSEFVAYFLSYLRSQTDKILKTNTNALQILQHQNTPEKIFNSQRKHRRSISEPNSSDQDSKPKDLLTVNDRSSKSHGSPYKDKSSHKKPGRRVKTKLFLETEPLLKSRSHENSLNLSPKTDSDESRISSGVSSLIISSTPLKNNIKASEYPCLSSPVTPNESRSISRHSSYSYLPNERCDTPRINHRNRMSNSEKCMPSLADYIANAQPSKSSKKKKNNSKNLSNDSSTADSNKIDLDISNSDMFPEIGAKRQSGSLRLDKEKRRIKPTNLDSVSKRSFSLNSFNTESFQQPSVLAIEENLAFKHQILQPKELGKSFEAERNMLKQERHKLMEKFNILNTSSPPKMASTPQIKVIKKDSFESSNFITADLNKVKFKEKIDVLIEIYICLLKNNFVLNRSSEIYFLISILLSKQFDDDYSEIEDKLDNNNLSEFILRSIHNCSYFAVKCLWGERFVLELMLDKTSLKLLGENKQVRSFYPELAKFLLNLYGLKCEAELLNKDDKVEMFTEHKFNNGFVCFNFETDNVDNFPSMLSFHNFKKQRDLFYEILRWWSEPSKTTTCFRTSLRSRVKSLLSLAVTPDNHAHLARLICDHIVAECLSQVQESKLSKLQKRLMGPSVNSGQESHRLPKFTDREQFYKDLIAVAENESFRIHVRDALTTELLRLNSTVTLADLRNASTSNNILKGYLQIIKKLCALAKFVGYITSLAYTQIPVDYAIKSGLDPSNIVLNEIPKEKIFKTEIEVRNYVQPPIDLKQILINSQINHRLILTIPWLVNYLAMLDYTTLRTNYFTELLKNLFQIYQTVLKDINFTNETINESKIEHLKRNTVIFLTLCLGWLFDLPQFPQDFYYSYNLTKINLQFEKSTDQSLDFLDLINEYVLFEICGYLREFNSMLLTSNGSVGKDMNSFRHITPVTMTLNTTDRIKNKERQIQARLEEELIKSQPSSTRRVLDIVIDRISSATIKELNAVIVQSRNNAKTESVRLVQLYGHDQASLVHHLQMQYQSELRVLQSKLVEVARNSLRNRASNALVALLATNVVKAPLESVAIKAGLNRVGKWIDENCSNVSILCKDIEAEVKNLLVLGENSLPISPNIQDITVGSMDTVHVSPSNTLINLKEHLCLLLDYEPCDHDSILNILDATKQCCSTDNIFSRPTTSAAILQLTCELCIIYISRCPQYFDATFLQKINAIWNFNCPDRKKRMRSETPPLRNFGENDDRCVTPISDDDLDNSNKIKNIKINNSAKTAQSEPEVVDLTSVSRILCARNIMLLSTTRMFPPLVWEKMAEFLVFLLKYDYLSEDSLTEQCLAVYRQDWPQNILENLSRCMRSVSTQWGRNAGGKFSLFLDFLAEYCNDIDYEQD